MPVKKEREYRTLVAPLVAQSSGEKRIQSECYVEGYATTFNAPYLLYEFEDGTKIYERIDAHALDSADMSDVIMQYDHEGRVFARQSNNTLILEPDVKGLFVAADLSRTDLARGLYQDISAGMITKMSWAFTVAEESYDRETHTRTILKIKKVYDTGKDLERDKTECLISYSQSGCPTVRQREKIRLLVSSYGERLWVTMETYRKPITKPESVSATEKTY